MKIKSGFASIVLAISSVLFISISTASTASAGDCSAADPCQTWAMLDENNVVINVIVCQPSVCGSGVWNDRKVVLQVSADPVTHTPQSGHNSPPGEPDRKVTYNEEQKTFSQEGVTWSAPQVNTAVVDTTTLVAIINPNGTQSNPATISAIQGELTESKVFDKPKTREQLAESVQDTSMLKKHLNRFFELLRGWIIN
jgi:hypothetical protein